MSFEEHFGKFIGSQQELLVNRPSRIEHHAMVNNCSREEAAAIDAAYLRIMNEVPSTLGKIIDEQPPTIRKALLMLATFSVGEVSLELSQFLREIIIATELSGEAPLVVNPRRPDCDCSNCELAREVNGLLRSERGSEA